MVNPGDRFNLEKAIAFATEAIKAAMYLNGGGAVALMTLIGAVGKGSAGGVQIKGRPCQLGHLPIRARDLRSSIVVCGGLPRSGGVQRARQSSGRKYGGAALGRRREVPLRRHRAALPVSVAVRWRCRDWSLERCAAPLNHRRAA